MHGGDAAIAQDAGVESLRAATEHLQHLALAITESDVTFAATSGAIVSARSSAIHSSCSPDSSAAGPIDSPASADDRFHLQWNHVSLVDLWHVAPPLDVEAMRASKTPRS